ncbi:DNA gyrase inhibitor YacG [Pontibacter sp. JAM-7]|uniref:DNA gyrase inhibitor YacG n=1 Tax=Pontibacter sp. JAM-7 TaxID=3366581 RepID=UPI003AF72D4E
MSSKPHVNCPSCGKKSLWTTDNPFRPFCCERCKLIDLGAWANEEYQIPTVGNSDQSSSEAEDFEQQVPLNPTKH